MASIRKLGTALVLAAVIAGGAGTTSLEAAGKKKSSTTTDGLTATCSYLYSIMTYPYTSPTVMVYTVSLYNYYGCSVQ